MPVYHATEISNLTDKLNGFYSASNRAAALAINKTTTVTLREAVERIAMQVTLKKPYIKKHLVRVRRASPASLRAVIAANERATLLSRYEYYATTNGIRVAINRTGGFREIKGAKIIKSLRGSAVPAIGLRNREALKAFEQNLASGVGPTAGKAAKLERLRPRAEAKPYGMTPLHSRSINQLFTTVRKDLNPVIRAKLRRFFVEDWRRLKQ